MIVSSATDLFSPTSSMLVTRRTLVQVFQASDAPIRPLTCTIFLGLILFFYLIITGEFSYSIPRQ